MTLDDSRTSRALFAGVSFLTVLTWYALPDAVRSRKARGVIKTGLLGLTLAGASMIPEVYPEARSLTSQPKLDLPTPAIAAIAAGATTVAVAGTIWGEKAVFAHGERKRASGVRCAHTPLALVLALATGAASLVDWAKLAGRIPTA